MKKALHLILALLIAQLTYAQTTLPNQILKLATKNTIHLYLINLLGMLTYRYMGKWKCSFKVFDKFPTYLKTDAKIGDYTACRNHGILVNLHRDRSQVVSKPICSIRKHSVVYSLENLQRFKVGINTVQKYDGVTDTAAIYAILSQWSGSERVEIARAEIYL